MASVPILSANIFFLSRFINWSEHHSKNYFTDHFGVPLHLWLGPNGLLWPLWYVVLGDM